MQKSFPASILRERYLNKVIPFIGKGLIKVFTGQRRVGKSYLLFQLMEHIKSLDAKATILYVNKEDLSYSFIKTGEDLHGYVVQHQAEQGRTYVFIDEIQDIENFEAALRSLLLDERLDLYCTGSNAQLLSGDIAGKLSGRAIEITVYSLSYEEFLQFHSLKNTDASLHSYMKFGGLPYLKHLELNEAVAYEYLKNIYSSILFRDIINRHAVRNSRFLEQLVFFLASNTGSLFSAKKISDFLKSQRVNMAPNQVQVYLQHLTNAFLIHPVKRYDIVGKRLFEIGEKYYFEDLGIRNALWGYRLEDRGKIVENLVHNHLLSENFQVTVGNIGDKEIDFIAQKNGEKCYVQVALSLTEASTMEREFGNLQKIDDNYPKLVVTLEHFSGNTVEGIIPIDLRSFLSNEW